MEKRAGDWIKTHYGQVRRLTEAVVLLVYLVLFIATWSALA